LIDSSLQNETDKVAGNMKRELEIEKELEDVSQVTLRQCNDLRIVFCAGLPEGI
jgi:hypothetical protein